MDINVTEQVLVSGLCFLIYEKEGIQNAKPFVKHHFSCAEKRQ